MSSPLSEVDHELLREVPSSNTAKATMAKASDESGLETHGDHHGTEFTPLNATAGTLVKVSSNGDKVETGKVSQHAHNPPHIPTTVDFLSPYLIISIHQYSTRQANSLRSLYSSSLILTLSPHALSSRVAEIISSAFSTHA